MEVEELLLAWVAVLVARVDLFVNCHVGFKIWTSESKAIFHKEYKFVVVDICPHSNNQMWCPKHSGQKNDFGVHNHFDFATVPADFDNYYFEFTPEPCDHEMKSRLARMSSCHLA